MACPTQADLDEADALVAIGYENWQLAIADFNAAGQSMSNAQASYYTLAYEASALWMEWMMCNQGMNMGFAPGDQMLTARTEKVAVPPQIEAAIKFCRKFEKECPAIAAGQRHLHLSQTRFNPPQPTPEDGTPADTTKPE